MNIFTRTILTNMAEPSLLPLLASIASNPQAALAAFIAKPLKLSPTDVELALRAWQADDNLTRAAILGLFLDTYRPQPCTPLGPVDPMRSPASGFTIRDVVYLPENVKRPTAHSHPQAQRLNAPSAVPMIVEVQSVGFEARPDLVAVVETALDDEPSDATQLFRAFVAGFRGYQDCPDVSNGRPELAAVIS